MFSTHDRQDVLTGRLLVVDGEPATRWTLERALRGWQSVVWSAADVESGVPLDDTAWEAILVGHTGPEQQTLHLIRNLRARFPGVPVILLAPGGRGSAAALRAGSFDCLSKPLDPDALLLAVQRATAWRRLHRENERLERAVGLLRRREEAARTLLPAPPCQLLSCALSQRLTLEELEDRYVEAVLRLTGGNKVRAAEILGIHRRTLYRRADRRRHSSTGP